ncbi:MAG: sulfite exporter TauE/SafE family protein [Paludibacteraceae bacterium]|nr:sulfite exporter TauE/SafE family protein [Paludibacteraceae bacterium]MBP7274237.1 sulfite exporter TauE/SafE family protein [Saprospiraceae bacterium]MBP8782355.1 sulfite exporter TauE/SafE family protein [Paludibacteraceae bacterium]MBP9647633.1 sulfite exporter TauE/SafE family protein [Paludibacteraceae bacterium]HOH75195.1 aromatic aminobenezylarsenical efflux permease ArsG family transporter [Paludibacteraceae bacterium]
MNYTELLHTFSEFPIVLALLLGLLVAIDPCPLAMNIGAIAFLGKDIQDKRKVFINGLLYTLGRVLSYTVLGIVLLFVLQTTTNLHTLQTFFTSYGELLIGAIFLVVGIFMLDLLKPHKHEHCDANHEVKTFTNKRNLSPFALGIVLALAFCPYGAALFFGVLIPVSVESNVGYLLPILFAISTSIPVALMAWLLAFSVSNLNIINTKIHAYDKWIKRSVAIILIVVGIYYVSSHFIGHTHDHHLHHTEECTHDHEH